MDVDDNDNDNGKHYLYYDAPPPMYSSHTSTPYSRSSFDLYQYPTSILRAPRMGFVPLPDDDVYENEEFPPPPYMYENEHEYEYQESRSRRFPSYCTYTPPSPATSLPLPPSPSSSTATVSLATTPSSSYHRRRTSAHANTYTPPSTHTSLNQRPSGLNITTSLKSPMRSSKPTPSSTSRSTSSPSSSATSGYGYSFCWYTVCPPEADELTPPPSPPRKGRKDRSPKQNTSLSSSRTTSLPPSAPAPFAPCRRYLPLPS